MTVVVGVATPEGLVLAGDSRATILDENDRHRIASDSVQKVFRVGRFGVASYGALLIGDATVAGLMDQFEAGVGEEPPADPEGFSTSLQEFFSERFEATLEEPWDTNEQGIPLGFLVCGYDADGVGHVYHVTVPETALDVSHVTTVTRGILWQGQVDAINRLIYGYDGARLSGLGVTLPKDLVEAMPKLAYALNWPITIQDGVDCACFLVRTAVDMQRFSMGAECDGNRWEVPGVGGPVQVLAIERRGASWVEQLELTAPRRPGAAEGELS
jgi:hypothetical protein